NCRSRGPPCARWAEPSAAENRKAYVGAAHIREQNGVRFVLLGHSSPQLLLAVAPPSRRVTALKRARGLAARRPPPPHPPPPLCAIRLMGCRCSSRCRGGQDT